MCGPNRKGHGVELETLEWNDQNEEFLRKTDDVHFSI